MTDTAHPVCPGCGYVFDDFDWIVPGKVAAASEEIDGVMQTVFLSFVHCPVCGHEQSFDWKKWIDSQ